MSTTTHGDMMDDRHAAPYIGLSVSTLRAWRVRGGGPRYRKMGAAVRYSRADLDAYIAASGRRRTRDRRPDERPPLGCRLRRPPTRSRRSDRRAVGGLHVAWIPADPDGRRPRAVSDGLPYRPAQVRR